MIKHIQPNWNVEEYRRLEFQRTWHKDLELNQRYVDSGHLADAMIIYNRFETHGLPDSADYIRSFFSDLKHVTLSAMLLKPGNYIPQHWDLYGAYSKVFDVNDASIMRAMVMLEDGVPGQIFQLGSDTITDWRAGDVFCWYDQTVHATYNFSMADRYAVQVTGVCQ